MGLADKLGAFVPVWRRSTGNRFTGPTIDQETGNQTGLMERVSQNAAFTGMRLASMQQAMHLRPRSQLASQYVRQSLYGQP